MKKLVPKIILENYVKNNFHKRFEAYSLFIDISGFTEMTEKMMKEGKEGAEVFSHHLNDLFDKAVDIIYKNNGFVSIFEGDSFTALFKEKKCRITDLLNSANSISNLFKEEGELKTKFGIFRLKFNMGLSYGETQMHIIENKNQNSFYFEGESINKAATAEKHSPQNGIVFSKNLFEKFNCSINMKYRTINDNFFLIENIPVLEKTGTKIKNNREYKKTMKDFYPESIFNKKLKGEFRDVVTVFLTIEKTKKLKEHISSIIEKTHKYGGYFNNISLRNRKACLLIYFGTPTTNENIVQRASKLALEIHNLKKLNSKMGMSYGRVFTGLRGGEKRTDFTCLGTEINIAARLMQEAGKNDIFIDTNIYKNLKDSHQIKKISAQYLKGISKKVPIYNLISRRKDFNKNFFKNKFIGRKKQIRKLIETADPLKENKFGGIVYIEGTAGIGKTRLTYEFRKKLGNNIKWLYLPSNEIIRKSFNPFKSFLRSYFNQNENNSQKQNRTNFEEKINNLKQKIEEPEIKNELERSKSFLAALINIHKENSLYYKLKPEGRYKNTLYALKNLILAESLIHPVILYFEDSQWMDNDSISAIEHITRDVKNYPFLIISECRFKEDGEKFRFRLNNINKTVITLQKLSRERTANIVENILGSDISKEILSLIWKKSEGNPFYAEQIAKYLKENNLINKNKKNDNVAIQIPDKINTVIISRLDKLTEELKQIIQTASVLGREFYVNILSRMLKNENISKKIKEIEKRNIWSAINEIKYIFKHALIRETAYNMQLKERLRKIHKLAANTIESIYKKNPAKVYGDLGYHYEKAEEYEKAAKYIELEGNHAKDNYQNQKALNNYDKLLNNYNLSNNKRTEIMFKKGIILRFIGKVDKAKNTFKKIIESNDSNQLTKIKSIRLLGELL
ncbi:MAG: AAA family ATPase [Kosmotoga sp.]|nr:MAG: AAA family ATPase [Kosmotoga sp.]